MKRTYAETSINRQQTLRAAALLVCMVLLFPAGGFAAERSIIVSFHAKPGPSEKALIKGANGIVKHAYDLIPAMAVSMDEKDIEKLRKDKKVAYIEDDAIFTASDEYADAWGVGHISADVAHASGNSGAGISVAVIDTGIDYTHEDLAARFAGGYDFVFDDSDPFDDNYRSHGTHVAGILAAEGNGIGVVGVVPEADIYALKVLDGAGFGLASWVISALEWCVLNGIDIANLSLEGPDVQALHDACDSAYDAGVLLVAAAGNTNGGSVKYPGAYGSVIAVTGTDASDMKAYFSPVGPEVEIAAPGLDILSTIAGSAYGLLSGTSQASPHVAGTAALFWATQPLDGNGDGNVNDEVRALLQTTAIDLGDAGFDTTYGFGLVDAAAAACTTPPVRQTIGIDDSVFDGMAEADCRVCHDNALPDRHHLLYGTTIPEPTDAPFGIPGELFACLACHASDCGSGECNFLIERNCTVCHSQGASDPTIHHRSDLAQGTLPQGPDCRACHGAIVDNMNDGHFVSAEPPFMSTPKRSAGTGLPYNSRGNGAGACDYCHDEGSCRDGIAVETSMVTHHSTGLGDDQAKCGWCHDFSLPFEEQIRVCENCHGRDSLHNIQVDSDDPDGYITVGVENPGYGHIGDPDDCWGCHGFSMGASSAPDAGPVAPQVDSLSPALLIAGAEARITLSGSGFVNVSGSSFLSSEAELTAMDGTIIPLTREAISPVSMTVTVPAMLAAGIYEVRVVKDATVQSNPVILTIVPAVEISATMCSACLNLVTISGSGFGDRPPDGAEAYVNVEQEGISLEIISWSDSMIEAVAAGCNFSSITVNTLYGSATWQQ